MGKILWLFLRRFECAGRSPVASRPCHKSAPLELWGPPCFPSFPFYRSSLSGVPVVISVSYLNSCFLCSFRRSRCQSGALAHLINTTRLKALSSRGRASFFEPAWVCPNPILEDIGTNQRGSSVFVTKSLSGGASLISA
jgi:hypothetical protein